MSAGAALALLIVMFAFEWYGVDGIPGKSEVSTVENGWHGLTIVRWVMLLTIAVTLGSLLRNAARGEGRGRAATGAAIAGLGAVTSLLLIYRVLIDLPQPASVVDQKLGAYLGVLCALVIAAGGYEMLSSVARAPGASATPDVAPGITPR